MNSAARVPIALRFVSALVGAYLVAPMLRGRHDHDHSPSTTDQKAWLP